MPSFIFIPSPEVLLILLLIGIPVYFTNRWAFRKIISNPRTQDFAAWATTLVATLLLYNGLILSLFWYLNYEPGRDFDRGSWFADEQHRYQMREDLIESGQLIGLPEQALVGRLGEPKYRHPNKSWSYEMGTSSAGFGWAIHFLVVYFENGTVSKVEAVEMLD